VNAHRGKTIRPALHERIALAATFTHAALSYWLTVFPRVCVYIARWQRLARRIPDPVLRHLALAAIVEKRGNIEGAAAFAAFVPWRRRAAATMALSAFQAAYNLLDMLGEQPSEDPVLDGRRLHEALVYAVSPPPAPGALEGRPEQTATDRGPREGASGERTSGEGSSRGGPSVALDWYEHHPRREDGGYLNQLLSECRAAFGHLPSHRIAAPAAQLGAARIVAFQSLNLSESQGDHAGLERWARDATPPGTELRWWETAAAAGSSLGVHALIAAAADARLSAQDVGAIERAYFPWIGGLHSLLDNLIDKREDEAAGHRSLVEYYGPERAAQRMRWMAEQATVVASEMPHSRRHTVILAAMIANYLSAPEAHGPQLEPVSQAVLATTGTLARPTMLVFELRRLPTRLRNTIVYRFAGQPEKQPPGLDSLI
jgi:tetraprenyl-beta-curcumene synthase